MRSVGFSALLLALVALLLVLAAGFIFLFQAELRLRDQVRASLAEADQLRQAQAETELELAAAEATRDAVAIALATAESANVDLEGQLVDSQQQIDVQATQVAGLTGEVDAVKADLAALQDEQRSLPPQAWIINPADDEILPAGQPVSILIAASDPFGLSSVSLEVDGEELSSYSVNGDTFFWRSAAWTPPTDAEGEHAVTVTATNENDVTSREASVTFTLSDIDARNAAIRAAVEANVSDLRGLEPLSPIQPVILNREQLRERIEADFAAENTPEETRKDVLELAAFDFMERDYDLYAALITLRSEGILGFYDPETAEFVVVTDDVLLDPAAQWTHAHEFVHVLQDQHYSLEAINDESLDSEARAALRALAEGEAELVQYLYLFDADYFTRSEAESILNDPAETDTRFLEDLPPVLVSNMAFPYNAGANFVSELYREGGFEAVDAAWRNPPRSTEHILHPDRYLAGDDPQIVALAPLTDTLDAATGTPGWQLVDEDILGEFFLREYLAQQLPATEVNRAATGWGGDRYAVYYQPAGDEMVMALRLAWDTPEDAAEFGRLYPTYPEGLFRTTGDPAPDAGTCWPNRDDDASEYICFRQSEDQSFVVRGPSREVIAAVMIALLAGDA